jgi:hypothetical protein
MILAGNEKDMEHSREDEKCMQYFRDHLGNLAVDGLH